MADLTIRDVARIAGVSTTAVSFVLNDRPGVSDATRAHIKEVIARTGFTPNVHTRRLNLGRSFTINVVLYWHSHDLFNQFALETMYGIFQSCKGLGYSVMFTFVDRTMDCTQLMESIRSKDCDGLILSQIEDPVFLSRLQQENIPFVCVDSHVKKDGKLPLVEVDYYQAAADSVRYLHKLGHEKIGFLCPSTPLELHAAIFSGYTDALCQSNLVCNPAWIGNIDFAPDSAGKFFKKLYAANDLPTAFLCGGDSFAVDFIQAAKAHGLRIPEDLSIIGMDDIVVSRYIDPPLTTMTFGKAQLGKTAVDVLVKMIEGQKYDPITLLPVSLVERASVKKLK